MKPQLFPGDLVVTLGDDGCDTWQSYFWQFGRDLVFKDRRSWMNETDVALVIAIMVDSRDCNHDPILLFVPRTGALSWAGSGFLVPAGGA